MSESLYLTKFKKLQELAPDKFSLVGGRLLIEEIPAPEMKTAGGLIIGQAVTHKATAHDNKSRLGVVLLAGSGYEDDQGNEIPTDVKQGEVVLLPSNAIFFSTFPGLTGYTDNKICLAREGDVAFKFGSIEDFEFCQRLLAE